MAEVEWTADSVGRSQGRLDPTVGKARKMMGELLGLSTTGRHKPVENPPLILIGCSGGPDSLALAAVAVFFARRGEVRVGAVVVDHQMQPGSADVASTTVNKLTALGLNPVELRTVNVEDNGSGPEAAARAARFEALDQAAKDLGAQTVLLGHTMNDQAESVLLGLARGSGTRSLAGIREHRGIYARPFLGLRRDEILDICEALNLDPWHDPSNQNEDYLRVRVRHTVLPFLAEQLGTGISESLARTASILAADADYLDQLAAAEFAKLAGPFVATSAHEGRADREELAPVDALTLPEKELRELAPALRLRVLALAVVHLGGQQPSQERLLSAQALLERKGSAGPVQLAGKVSAYRISRSQGNLHDPGSYGKLVFKRSR